MLEQLTSAEVTELLAYYGAEPFGEWRADLRAGIVAATLVNVNRGRGTPPAAAKDFMPFQDRKPEDPKKVAGKIKEFFMGLVHGQRR